MSNINIKLLIDLHDSIDEQGITDEYIEALEAFIIDCNEALANGEELVDDSVYDTVREWLEDANPDSYVLKRVWSNDVSDLTDLDVYQAKFPMVSIQTIKDLSDKGVDEFISRLPADGSNIIMNASMKMNGHGIRVVFKDGVLVKAHTRGRSSNGRDITRQCKIFIGDKMSLKGLGLVEVRGEVLLPFSNLDEAKGFNPDIKSAFSGVASMIKDSATDDEIKLLRFVAYNIYYDGMQFNSLSEKLDKLAEYGFEIPYQGYFSVNRNNCKQKFDWIVGIFAKRQDGADGKEPYDYYTDGVVVAVDDIKLFSSFGGEEHHHFGNLALKIGRWKQDMYSAKIIEIKWKRGKNKLSPVAVVEPTLTMTGNTVQNVPLYNPYNILILNAYPGETIHFRYGGEAGVKPCLPNGENISEV